MKKGITLLTLIFTLILMGIIIGSAAIYGLNNVTTAEYRKFIDLFQMTDNNVNAYILENDELPITGNTIALESTNSSFQNSVILNGDDVNELYVVSMQKLKNTVLKLGYGNVSDGDVFIIAEDTNNVYYLKGTKHKGNYIHSLNDILLNDR